MGCILTFDVGTTSVKTSLLDERFSVMARHSAEYRLIVSAGGVVEMQPESYWAALCKGSRAVIDACPKSSTSIEVIVVTTQGETFIPMDCKGEPLSNAIVWLDSRATEEADFLRKTFRSEIYYPVTGLGQIDEVAPVSKLLNIKNKRPDLFSRISKILLLEDYLLYRMSGIMVTERSLLSSTGYFDIRKESFYSEILDYAGIPGSFFPEVLDCAQCVGPLLSGAATALGIVGGAMVVTGAMDQIAGAVGAGNIGKGVVTETTGTALVMGATTEVPDFSHPSRPTIYRHARSGLYYVLTLSNTAGIVLKWFKDEFCGVEAASCGEGVYAELGRLAQGVRPGADGLTIYPHFSGVLTPTADPAAQGIFFGVTLNTGKAHFVRAIMEGVAYMLRENLEIFEQMGIEVRHIRSSGGGARSVIWSQIKSDVTGYEIMTLQDTESTSIGAAMLGALAVGWYPDFESMGMPNPPAEYFSPEAKNVAIYDEGYRKYCYLHHCSSELKAFHKH